MATLRIPTFPGIDVSERPFNAGDTGQFGRIPNVGNANVPLGGSAEAQAFRSSGASAPGTAVPLASAAEDVATTAPTTAGRMGGALRGAGSFAKLASVAAIPAAAGYVGAAALRNFDDPSSNPGPATNPTVTPSVSQIPTGGNPQAPAAEPYNFFQDNELGRNVANTANAVASIPFGAVPGLAGVVGKAGAALNSLRGGATAGMDLGQSGAGALSPAAPTSSATPTAATSPASTPVVTAPQGDPRSNVLRDGNSYSGAPGISGNITVNGGAPSAGGPISAQNNAAATGISSGGDGGQDNRVLAAQLAAQQRGDLKAGPSFVANQGPLVTATNQKQYDADRAQHLLEQALSGNGGDARVAGANVANLRDNTFRSADAQQLNQVNSTIASNRNAVTERGQDQTLRGGMYTADQRGRSSLYQLLNAQRNSDRTYGLDQAKFGLDQDKTNQAAREDAQKNLPGQIAGQLPPGADGKPDAAKAAAYAAGLTALQAQRVTALQQHLQLNPGDAGARSELAGINARGPAQIGPDAVHKFILSEQAKELAAQNASNINPRGGTFVEGDGPITSLRRESHFFGDQYRTNRGDSIPAYAIDRPGSTLGFGGHRSTQFDGLKQR